MYRCGFSSSACSRTAPPGAPGDAVVGNTVVINPVVEPLGEEMQLRWEGCLSIPGLRAAVPRFHARALLGRGL